MRAALVVLSDLVVAVVITGLLFLEESCRWSGWRVPGVQEAKQSADYYGSAGTGVMIAVDYDILTKAPPPSEPTPATADAGAAR